MSEIRTYLEAKAAEPPKEWLRRDPRTTHPEILALVREFQDAGGFYDDDADRYVNEHAGDLPPHEHHGVERHPLIEQLGHEVYIAKGCLKDEAASAAVDASRAEGFELLDDCTVEDGARYVIRLGTVYVGQDVPTFGEPKEVRARVTERGPYFLPKGARSRGYLPSGPVLIRSA